MAYGGLSHIEHLGGAREVPAFRDGKHRLHFYIGHFLLLHYENLYVSKIISFAFIAKILYHIEGRNAIHFLRSTYKYITRSIYAYTNI